MVNSKLKGNKGEVQVLNLFRNWWGGHWERHSMGYAGSDLITPENFPFAIEVKFDDKIQARHFFHPTKFLIKCWQQAKSQAADKGKSPLLVAKAEGTWYCIGPLSMSMSDNGEVLTRKLDGDSVEIQTIDSFMLTFEDANPRYFKPQPKLVVKTKSKKTA